MQSKTIFHDVYSLLKWYSGVNKQINFQKTFLETPSPEQKIFIIGLNKTGTTSVKKALISHRISVGHQGKGSSIFVYESGSSFFKELLKLCSEAQAFQDIPFSVPRIYKFLYHHFPNAKFILTTRDNSEQWFNSLRKFYQNIFNNGRRLSKRHLLVNDHYRFGYALIRHEKMFGGCKFFDPNCYHRIYNDHIKEARSFFSDKADSFLEINVAEQTAYASFCQFLGLKMIYDKFPWENKTNPN